MFYECSSLIELNISNFKFNQGTIKNGMFIGCSEELKKKIKEKYKNI